MYSEVVKGAEVTSEREKLAWLLAVFGIGLGLACGIGWYRASGQVRTVEKVVERAPVADPRSTLPVDQQILGQWEMTSLDLGYVDDAPASAYRDTLYFDDRILSRVVNVSTGAKDEAGSYEIVKLNDKSKGLQIKTSRQGKPCTLIARIMQDAKQMVITESLGGDLSLTTISVYKFIGPQRRP